MYKSDWDAFERRSIHAHNVIPSALYNGSVYQTTVHVHELYVDTVCG